MYSFFSIKNFCATGGENEAEERTGGTEGEEEVGGEEGEDEGLDVIVNTIICNVGCGGMI